MAHTAPLFRIISAIVPHFMAKGLRRDQGVRKRNSGSHLTCMGLFLSSGCFGFAVSSLFGAGRPFFVPSPAIRFAERAEGVKGPKRWHSLAACRLALLVFRSALTPEHAEGR